MSRNLQCRKVVGRQEDILDRENNMLQKYRREGVEKEANFC